MLLLDRTLVEMLLKTLLVGVVAVDLVGRSVFLFKVGPVDEKLLGGGVVDHRVDAMRVVWEDLREGRALNGRF